MTEPFEVRFPEDLTAIERDFLEGLARIVAGRPENPALADRAALGRIKPTQANVALEAGHSRTLISGGTCTLARVRAEVTRAREWHRRIGRRDEANAAVDGEDELTFLRRERQEMVREREEMRRQRDAAYTSDASSSMLAVALREAGRKADADVRLLRRQAERTVISERVLSAS